MPRSFNGTTQYLYPVNTTSGVAEGFGTGMFDELVAYTAMGWINAAGTVTAGSWYGETRFDDNNPFFTLRVNSGKAQVGARKTGNSGTPELNFVNSVATVADGTWHHFAYVQDGLGSPTTYWMFVDGVLDSSGTYTGGATLVSRFRIGNIYRASGDANFYTGKLAHIATWRRKLSPGEIAAIYRGIPIRNFSPHHYWPLLGGEVEPDFGFVGNYEARVNDGTVAPVGPAATGSSPQRAHLFRASNWLGQSSPVLKSLLAAATPSRPTFKAILL